MLFSKAKDKFLNWLVVFKWKSDKTQEQYTRHLNKFEEFLLEEYKRDINVDEITLDNANDFRIALHKEKKDISYKTANAYMISIRAFLQYLLKENHEVLAPTKIDLMKDKQRLVDFLSHKELLSLFDEIDTTDIRWKRDLAIIKMIYITWLRVSELTALNRDDVDFDSMQFTIRWKWAKLRMIFVNEEAKKVVEDYLQTRTDNFSPLFIRHNFDVDNINLLDNESVRLTRFFITNMIRERSLKAWISKKVSAHTIRHSFATTLLTAGADLRSIQELLWHSNISTTQVYTHVTNTKLKEVHSKFME